MHKLEKKVLEQIRAKRLIPENSHVICGFSGGADSVCLLSVLSALKRLLQIELKAVHVHHGLRGKEADADEAFCRAFCEKKEIPFTSVHVDVKKLVREKGLSVEEAARQLRYEALKQEAGSGALIAVAHHADDQAETILMNLIRGTGLKGLGGMPESRGNVVRPLLDITREEILKYISEKKLPYVTDSSNLSDDYTRNRIRHVLIPEMKGINGKACLHLLQAGRKAWEAEAYLSSEARAWAKENGKMQEDCFFLPRKKLKEQPQIFRRYVIIEVLRFLDIPLKDWGEVHLSAVDQMLEASKGVHLDLPAGAAADNTYLEIMIRKGNDSGKPELHDQDIDH